MSWWWTGVTPTTDASVSLHRRNRRRPVRNSSRRRYSSSVRAGRSGTATVLIVVRVGRATIQFGVTTSSFSAGTSTRRLLQLTVMTAGVGLAAGGAAWVLL